MDHWYPFEAPEGTAELHTLRYQMGATKRRRLSSRRLLQCSICLEKGLVFVILDAAEIGMDLDPLHHVKTHRHIGNFIYSYDYADYVCYII